MKTLQLSLNCPRCSSADVVYSCEPNCCFNHVCGNCLASFQLSTRELGKELAEFDSPSEVGDSLSATASCSKCEGINLFMLESSGEGNLQLVCSDCHSVLELEIQLDG
jgi:hypothetical protein